MNRLNFLLVTFVAAVFTMGIYSCAKDGASHSDLANQNVELRSRCGDNFNVAPTPTIINLPSENGLCCYSFTFTGVTNNLSYTVNGYDINGSFVGGPPSNGYPTYLCSVNLQGTVIVKCCLPKSVKTITIVLSDGSCVSLNLPPGDC